MTELYTSEGACLPTLFENPTLREHGSGFVGLKLIGSAPVQSSYLSGCDFPSSQRNSVSAAAMNTDWLLAAVGIDPRNVLPLALCVNAIPEYNPSRAAAAVAFSLAFPGTTVVMSSGAAQGRNDVLNLIHAAIVLLWTAQPQDYQRLLAANHFSVCLCDCDDPLSPDDEARIADYFFKLESTFDDTHEFCQEAERRNNQRLDLEGFASLSVVSLTSMTSRRADDRRNTVLDTLLRRAFLTPSVALSEMQDRAVAVGDRLSYLTSTSADVTITPNSEHVMDWSLGVARSLHQQQMEQHGEASLEEVLGGRASSFGLRQAFDVSMDQVMGILERNELPERKIAAWKNEAESDLQKRLLLMQRVEAEAREIQAKRRHEENERGVAAIRPAPVGNTAVLPWLRWLEPHVDRQHRFWLTQSGAVTIGVVMLFIVISLWMIMRA